MLEDMIKAVIDKVIEVKLPHLQHPAIMRAIVTSVTPEGAWNKYNLKILDKNGDIDMSFPELPGVKSKQSYLAGAILAVGFMYGELDPCIIEEVSDGWS